MQMRCNGPLPLRARAHTLRTSSSSFFFSFFYHVNYYSYKHEQECYEQTKLCIYPYALDSRYQSCFRFASIERAEHKIFVRQKQHLYQREQTVRRDSSWDAWIWLEILKSIFHTQTITTDFLYGSLTTTRSSPCPMRVYRMWHAKLKQKWTKYVFSLNGAHGLHRKNWMIKP